MEGDSDDAPIPGGEAEKRVKGGEHEDDDTFEGKPFTQKLTLIAGQDLEGNVRIPLDQAAKQTMNMMIDVESWLTKAIATHGHDDEALTEKLKTLVPSKTYNPSVYAKDSVCSPNFILDSVLEMIENQWLRWRIIVVRSKNSDGAFVRVRNTACCCIGKHSPENGECFYAYRGSKTMPPIYWYE